MSALVASSSSISPTVTSAVADTLLPEPLAVFELKARSAAVRYLRESDSIALEWQGGADLRAWYQAQWRAHCVGDVCVLVVDFNSFPIGQAAVHWQGKPTHRHIPDIQSLRVFGAFQGLGIGSHLLHACERVVRERSFSQVCLSVGTENLSRVRAFSMSVWVTL
jgi:GNAT superfamily N-acetyltransferase